MSWPELATYDSVAPGGRGLPPALVVTNVEGGLIGLTAEVRLVSPPFEESTPFGSCAYWLSPKGLGSGAGAKYPCSLTEAIGRGLPAPSISGGGAVLGL